MLSRRLSQEPGLYTPGETNQPAVDSKGTPISSHNDTYYDYAPSSKSSQFGVIGENRSQKTTQSAPIHQNIQIKPNPWNFENDIKSLHSDNRMTPILTGAATQKKIANHGDALLDLWYHHTKLDNSEKEEDHFSTNVENSTFAAFNDTSQHESKEVLTKNSSPSLNSPERADTLMPVTDNGPNTTNFKTYSLSELCRDFLRGSCKRKKCRFQHPDQEEFNTSLVKCDEQTRSVLQLGPAKKDLPTGAKNAGMNDDPNQVPCCDVNVQNSFDENGLIPLCYLRIWLKACALSQNKKEKVDKPSNVTFYGLSQAPLGPPQVLKHSAHREPRQECDMVPLEQFKQLEYKHQNAMNRITMLESQVEKLTKAFTSAVELKNCLNNLTDMQNDQTYASTTQTAQVKQNTKKTQNTILSNLPICSKQSSFLTNDVQGHQQISNFQVSYPVLEPNSVIQPVQPLVQPVPPGFQPIIPNSNHNMVRAPPISTSVTSAANNIGSIFASPWTQANVFTPISQINTTPVTIATTLQQPQTGYLPNPHHFPHHQQYFNPLSE